MGIKNGEGRVRRVARRERGGELDGVRIRRVRAVSRGERRRVGINVDVMVERIERSGEVEVSREVEDGESVEGGRSESERPRRPERSERRKVSRVRCRRE